MVTEMQYPDVYTEKNSVNISIAMDFYAVFRTDIAIYQGKTVFKVTVDLRRCPSQKKL